MKATAMVGRTGARLEKRGSWLVLASIFVAMFAIAATAAVSANTVKDKQKSQAPASVQSVPIQQSVKVKPQQVQVRPGPLQGVLSKEQYQRIVREHEIKTDKMRIAPVRQTATARPMASQNNTFRGQYDCDDRNRAVHPGQSEVCDGIDNDCDGDIDEGVSTTFYLDADGDGWGDGSRTFLACRNEPGYVSRANDCDDSSRQVYPGANDIPGNGIDENCSGADSGAAQN